MDGNRLLYRQTCESLWESCLGIFGVVTTATSQKKYARAIYSSIMARSVFDLDSVFYNPSDKLLHVLHKELNRVRESGRKRSNINVMYVLYSEGLVPCYASKSLSRAAVFLKKDTVRLAYLFCCTLPTAQTK